MTVSFDDWDKPIAQDTSLLNTSAPEGNVPTIILETVHEQSSPSSSQPTVTETAFPYEANETSAGRPLERESKANNNFHNKLNDTNVRTNFVELPINLEDPENCHEKDETLRVSKLEKESSTKLVHDGSSLSGSVDSGLHQSTDRLLDSRDTVSQHILDSTRASKITKTEIYTVEDLKIGQMISLDDSKIGYIRYIGTTDFASGKWVGVELDLPIGMYHLLDSMFHKFFQCILCNL